MEEFVTSKDGFNRGCKLRVIGKRRHYFVKRLVNKLYPLEIRNSDNSVVKNGSVNDDVIDYGTANRHKRLAAERGTLIRRLNKSKIKLIDSLIASKSSWGVLKRNLVFVLKIIHKFYFNLCLYLAHVFCSYFHGVLDDSKTRFFKQLLVLIIVEVLNSKFFL